MTFLCWWQLDQFSQEKLLLTDMFWQRFELLERHQAGSRGSHDDSILHHMLRTSFEKRPDILYRHPNAGFESFGRNAGAVRSDHDIRQRGDGVRWWERLGGEDVQAGARDRTSGERIEQRRLINDRSTRRVDQDCALLHHAEFAGAEHAGGLLGQS